MINKLKKIEKIEEILAVTWCIANFIPLSKPYTWNIVFYEELVNKINEEIQNIFYSIGEKDIPRSAYKIFRKPSLVTMKDDEKYIKKPNKQLSIWKDNFSQKQINNILKILSYFNMDFYSENIEPDYDKL